MVSLCDTNVVSLIPTCIIVVGLIYKRSVDIRTENFSVAFEPLISCLDPLAKIYIMGDFNINLFDHNLSPTVENFINQMISKNLFPIIDRPTRVTPQSCTLVDNIFCFRVEEVVIWSNNNKHF